MDIYGYVRVSSVDQNEDRQVIALKEVGVDAKNTIWTNNPARILTDHITSSLSEI